MEEEGGQLVVRVPRHTSIVGGTELAVRRAALSA